MSPTSPRPEFVVARISGRTGKVEMMTKVVPFDDPLLTGPECARLVGVVPGTWRSLVKQGYAPPADEPDLDRPPHMRMPRWRASTVEEFRRNRPGRGGRPKKIRTEADGGNK